MAQLHHTTNAPKEPTAHSLAIQAIAFLDESVKSTFGPNPYSKDDPYWWLYSMVASMGFDSSKMTIGQMVDAAASLTYKHLGEAYIAISDTPSILWPLVLIEANRAIYSHLWSASHWRAWNPASPEIAARQLRFTYEIIDKLPRLVKRDPGLSESVRLFSGEDYDNKPKSEDPADS